MPPGDGANSCRVRSRDRQKACHVTTTQERSLQRQWLSGEPARLDAASSEGIAAGVRPGRTGLARPPVLFELLRILSQPQCGGRTHFDDNVNEYHITISYLN